MSNQIIDAKTRYPSEIMLFKELVQKKRLSHAYILEGTSLEDLTELSVIWASIILNQGQFDQKLYDRIIAGDVPDVYWIRPEKKVIKVNQVRDALTYLQLKSFYQNYKICLIQDAIQLTNSAANTLLKFLEHPPKNTMILLTAVYGEQLLPTIQSRCQMITCRPYALQDDDLSTFDFSKELQALLKYAHPRIDTILYTVKQNQWAQEGIVHIDAWLHLLLQERCLDALLYSQKELLERFKEKDQQQFFFDVLIYLYRYIMLNKIEKRPAELSVYQRRLLVLTDAYQKWKSHVTFPNLCDYIVLSW